MSKKIWRAEEKGWIVQCDGGAGFIHGTNASTKYEAIANYQHGLGDKDPTWSELSDPVNGHYRVVKVIIKVSNW